MRGRMILLAAVVIVGLVVYFWLAGRGQRGRVVELPPTVELVEPPATAPPASGMPPARPVEAKAAPSAPVAPPATTAPIPAPGEELRAVQQAALRRGQEALAAGKRVEAWRALSEGLPAADPPARTEIKKTLASLSNEILFSADQFDGSTTYAIVAGDTLSAIGKRYKIPYRLLMRMNGLTNPDLIRVDQKLKVVEGPFDVLVDLSAFTLAVYWKDQFVKEYRIGLGPEGSTPEGAFRVENKLENPEWYGPNGVVRADDPSNPLGERWIGFQGQYGIHGTNEPESIGGRSSKGCIRMYESDVEEVYDLVFPGESAVRVVR